MRGLGGFVAAFCSVSVILGGLYILRPRSGTEKAVKYIFSLIFVCCIGASLLGIKVEDFNFSDYSTPAEVSAESLSAEAARLTFCEALRLSEINFSEITVCTTKTENGSIVINKVIVYSSEEPFLIKEALGGDEAEYEIEVVYE